MVVLAILLTLGVSTWHRVTSAPTSTIYPVTLTVTDGMGAANIAAAAAAEGLVRSEFVLYMLLTKRYDPTQLYAGTYTLTVPQNVFQVAETIAAGNIDDTSVRVTLPEGLPARDMAPILAAALPAFDVATYLSLASTSEGMLYPETYFVAPEADADTMLAIQLETFHQTIDPLLPTIATSDYTLEEVLTLASIVEREANSSTSMKMVAGIFKNRLDIGMPLQADATIAYILDTPIAELRAGELAEQLQTVDSPYNTYTHNGLPPTPIGNPGLTAIMAVLEPTPSDYFYYLTDADGVFHYATTLREHNRNIERYLR